MKRYFSLFLIVALLPALLAVPARADEFDDTLVELLDFTMPNGGDTPWVGVALSNPLVTFTVPYYTAINYVDIVIQIGNATVPDAVYLKYVGRPNQEEVRLTIDKISDTMYRIYGVGATYTQDVFGLRFDFGSSTATASSITFKSVKFSPIPIEIYEMPVVGTLYNYGNNGQAAASTPFSYRADKVESTVTFTAFSDFDNSFLADMTPYNWQKYDYLDIHCAAWCQSVISVSAFLTDGTVVPLEVSTLVGEQTGNTALHIISIRADLTGLNRDFDGLMQINVTGSMFRGETCSFVLYGCRGGLKTESVNPVIYWLQSIPRSIAQWGQNLMGSINALPDKIAEALQGLFVPSDSAVQDMGQQAEDLAQDRFGGVYEGAQIVDDFASQLQPQDAIQILTVPVVNLDILGTSFPLGGWEVDLVPDGTEIIAETCKIIIDIIATLAFINGLKSRLERTLEQ